MGAMDEPLVEMWSLYALGNVIIILRIACRWKMVGIQGLKPDDYSSCFALVSYLSILYANDYFNDADRRYLMDR